MNARQIQLYAYGALFNGLVLWTRYCYVRVPKALTQNQLYIGELRSAVSTGNLRLARKIKTTVSKYFRYREQLWEHGFFQG
jgi:hypothetical protein